MEGTNLMKVAAHVRLNRRHDGLAIPTGKNLHACLSSALVVARYFLQELGLSPEIATLVHGNLHDDLFTMGIPGDRPQEGHPVLAIDDLYLFPCDARRANWCVVPPVWITIPDVLPDPDRELTLPMYVVREIKQNPARRPLYDALLLAVQMHVMDNLRRDLKGVLKDYLDEAMLPGGDNLTLEYTHLVLPAVRLLLHNLPCLKVFGHEKIETTLGRDWVRVENPSVRFSWTHASGIWRVWYCDGNSRNNWQEIDPLVQTPPPASQLTARQDFVGAFFRCVPHIISRRIKEVELPVLLNKTWFNAGD